MSPDEMMEMTCINRCKYQLQCIPLIDVECETLNKFSIFGENARICCIHFNTFAFIDAAKCLLSHGLRFGFDIEKIFICCWIWHTIAWRLTAFRVIYGTWQWIVHSFFAMKFCLAFFFRLTFVSIAKSLAKNKPKIFILLFPSVKCTHWILKKKNKTMFVTQNCWSAALNIEINGKCNFHYDPNIYPNNRWKRWKNCLHWWNHTFQKPFLIEKKPFSCSLNLDTSNFRVLIC